MERAAQGAEDIATDLNLCRFGAVLLMWRWWSSDSTNPQAHNPKATGSNPAPGLNL